MSRFLCLLHRGGATASTCQIITAGLINLFHAETDFAILSDLSELYPDDIILIITSILSFF